MFNVYYNALIIQILISVSFWIGLYEKKWEKLLLSEKLQGCVKITMRIRFGSVNSIHSALLYAWRFVYCFSSNLRQIHWDSVQLTRWSYWSGGCWCVARMISARICWFCRFDRIPVASLHFLIVHLTRRVGRSQLHFPIEHSPMECWLRKYLAFLWTWM